MIHLHIISIFWTSPSSSLLSLHFSHFFSLSLSLSISLSSPHSISLALSLPFRNNRTKVERKREKGGEKRKRKSHSLVIESEFDSHSLPFPPTSFRLLSPHLHLSILNDPSSILSCFSLLLSSHVFFSFLTHSLTFVTKFSIVHSPSLPSLSSFSFSPFSYRSSWLLQW